MSSVSHQTDAKVTPSGRAYADDTARTTDPSLGDLVAQLSTQVPDLIRSELRLAQAEVTAKGKRAGIGIGMFSVAGLLAFFGLAFVLTTVALLLDLFLPGWAAALVVAVVLLAGAGVAALLGKKKVAEAAPPTPERTIESVKEDIAAVKGATSRGAHR
jgi:uncharacterized membrane protein YqjE